MCDISKLPWPSTYLGRLQIVTSELRVIGVPTSAEVIQNRFVGVTDEQVEAILAALVLFGRIQKTGNLYSVPAPV